MSYACQLHAISATFLNVGDTQKCITFQKLVYPCLPNSFSVQGSDGATFNPYIQQKETLWFFNDQLCRSMPLVFQKNVQSAGNMPAYRFGPRKDVFRNNDLENYPQNACFCRDEPLCEITGEFIKKLIFLMKINLL